MARELVHILELRRALGRELAGYRQRADWSQAKLAAELHYHRTAICHLEAGRHPAPRDFWERADALLAAGGALVKRYAELVAAKHEHTVQQLQSALPHRVEPADDPAGDPNHDPVLCSPWTHAGTVKSAVGLRGGDSRVKRRVFLSLTGPALTAPAHQWLIHEPGPLVSGLAGRRISLGLVDRFSAMIAELRRMDDVAGGGSVLTLAEQQFGWVAGLLDQASYDEPTGRAFHVALAELGQLCGWGAYEAREHGLAQRYNITALRAAHSADDRLLGAHILGSMAKQAAHQGRPAEAATLAETALTGVRSHRTPRLLAELHLRRAYASARLQDMSACAEAISKARTCIEQLGSEGDPPWSYWVIPAWIIAEAGDCLLQLEQADRAAAMLSEGVALFDESFARDRQLYTIHLADACTRPGKQCDLDAAAGLGMASIDLAEGLDSTLTVDLLRDLYCQMTPHYKVAAVRDFLERARVVVQA